MSFDTVNVGSNPELEIKWQRVQDLIPFAQNARQHPKRQIKKLVASIKAFGFVNPIMTAADGTVLCGNGRLEAAKILGKTEVPTICIDHLSETQRRAFIIADNAIAEQGSWSKSLLKSELQGLANLGYDLELTGFDTIQIDNLLSFEDGQDPDDVVELPKPGTSAVTRLGDHWVIGDHQLFAGDARDPATYEALLGEERAELTLTDPPFNVRIAGNVSRDRHGEFLMGSGELSDAEFSLQLLRPALRCIRLWSKAGAIAFIFMDWRGGPQLLDAAQGVLHELKNLIVWVKSNAGMGSFYRSGHELIYVFKISPGQHVNNFGLGGSGRHRSNVWQYEGANTFSKGRMEDLVDHPTVKPKKMLADAILDCSRRGSIVLDPFAGSGSTLVAAQMTGRRGRGIELDPIFCDVILRRLAKETGVEPTLIDGTPLHVVTTQRAGTPGDAG